MIRILFLDDDDYRLHTFNKVMEEKYRYEGLFLHTAKSAAAMIELLKTYPICDEVCLDHDLGEDFYGRSNGDGMEVVNYMVENADKLKIGQVIVHSLNHGAAANMVSKLCSSGFVAKQLPFFMVIRQGL
jgi:ActR/RegA family two-component response regulator